MIANRPLIVYLHGFLGNPNELDFLGHKQGLYDVYGVPWATLLRNNKHATLGDVAMAINTYLDEAEIKGGSLYGYSMGGRLAMQLVSLYPHKWKSLILESAHVGFENGIQRREEQVKWEENFKQLTHNNTNDFLKKWYKQPLFKKSKALITNEAWKQKETYDIELIRQWGIQLQTANQGYFIPFLKEWKKPILYLAGKEDKKYSKLAKTIEKQVETAKSIIIEDSDHNVHVCNANNVKKTLDDFINNMEISNGIITKF
ncbi:hypothetical protein CL658_01760 [bacterium]|nr:hypothetical protein [bacterium]|tara:strand:+ start:1245 stop:2018 length:774 start_codon:yes stop_codon:yes gene_type:complete